MAEKLEVTTSESAFQLHLPSVVMDVYNGTNREEEVRKSDASQESHPMVHVDVQCVCAMCNAACCIMHCIINTCVCSQGRQGLMEKSKLSPVLYLKKYDVG